MTYEVFILFTFLGAISAGLLGALTGLGGGVIIIPLLTLGLNVPFHYAIGASLISVIATSSGSAVAYVKEGISNVRIGLFLELATTIGAIGGAFLAIYFSANVMAVVFGGILLFSIYMTLRKKKESLQKPEAYQKGDKWKLNGSYPNIKGEEVPYHVQNVYGGFSLMGVAGLISGLLGIGSGALKVLAMDSVMKIPFKVSTTTSNFMIGVTAAASAVIYFQYGYILPEIAAPAMLGVIIGAMLGSKLLMKLPAQKLKWIFVVVVFYLAIQMIYKGLTGGFQ